MAASLPEWVKLVIVDNGPDDGLRDWARQRGYRVIIPDRNLGFGAGCNLGARDCKTDFIFFLNPDTRLSQGSIEILLQTAVDHPEASAFGPEFSRESGKSYSYRPSKILNYPDRFVRPSRPKKTIMTPSLNGAGLFCRRQAFEAVGGFDENVFLFFEDDDLTIRLSAQAGPLYYVPAAKAYHGLGESSPPSDDTAWLKGYHFSWSQAYMLKKHNRNFWRVRPLLGALRRCISLKVLSSASRRQSAMGRLAGALAAAGRYSH